MRIRPIEPSDAPRLQEIWKDKGFECTTPDFSKMGGVVLTDDEGVVMMAIADRPTLEEYMLLDKSEWATPGIKMTWFERLHGAAVVSAKERGYTDVHAWVPKCARSFAYKLRKFFGWVDSNGPDGSWSGLTREL